MRRRIDLGAITSGGPRLLPLDQIQRHETTQPREHVSAQVIEEYSDEMAARADGVVINKTGQAWPALVVYEDTSGEGEPVHWLADGYHRLAAAERAGLAQIQVELHEGTLKDAVLYSVGANQTHGLRRTSADKQRAVRRALAVAGSEQSDNWIAERCGVSAPTVAKVRAALEQEGKIEPSSRRIGRDGREQYTKHQGRRVAPDPSAADAPRPAAPPSRPVTATWAELQGLRGADYGVLVAHWETSEQLRLLAEHGLALLADDGALVMALPQGELLAQLVIALEPQKRALQARGPVVVVRGDFTALLVYARGERLVPLKVASLADLVRALAAGRRVLHVSTEGGAAAL